MEKREITVLYRTALFVIIMTAIGGLAFAAGVAWSLKSVHAAERPKKGPKKTQEKVIYPEKTELDFDGSEIQGQVNNPGEFYFQRLPEERFDSLVKRRKNFQREMLRDVVLSK